ncbi:MULTISPECIES: hypothetical protein [Paenibacillus]|uniref:hypothetical protein n=1 Tax=Paenibacillus TaxID=44249 RepID=UPI00096FC11F|nr:hypothetical protein [Paenibacillus odorifer]OMD80423.1 hypothetical protein BSK53_20405 [Paenibacillus odorifer]
MRLSEAREIIEQNINLLSTYKGKDLGNGTTELSNYEDTIFAINNISKLGIITDEVKGLNQLPTIYFSSVPKPIILTADFNLFGNIIYAIKQKSNAALDLINNAVPTENEHSVNIKLPEYGDLKEIATFFNELDFIFRSTITSGLVDGRVEIEKFESGSMWIGVAVGTKVAANFIGKVAKAGLEIQEKYYNNQKMKRELEQLDLNNEKDRTKNDMLKVISDAMEKNLKLLISEKTEMLLKEENIEGSQEKIGNLERSLEKLGKLFYEGMQIRPSLTASEEIKQEFPQEPKVLNSKEVKLLKNDEE